MAEMSTYLENALINATLRNTSYTSPATVYVGLYTSDPTDANTGTEVSGGSYTRTAVTMGSPTDGVSTNHQQLSSHRLLAHGVLLVGSVFSMPHLAVTCCITQH